MVGDDDPGPVIPWNYQYASDVELKTEPGIINLAFSHKADAGKEKNQWHFLIEISPPANWISNWLGFERVGFYFIVSLDWKPDDAGLVYTPWIGEGNLPSILVGMALQSHRATQLWQQVRGGGTGFLVAYFVSGLTKYVERLANLITIDYAWYTAPAFDASISWRLNLTAGGSLSNMFAHLDQQFEEVEVPQWLFSLPTFNAPTIGPAGDG